MPYNYARSDTTNTLRFFEELWNLGMDAQNIQTIPKKKEIDHGCNPLCKECMKNPRRAVEF